MIHGEAERAWREAAPHRHTPSDRSERCRTLAEHLHLPAFSCCHEAAVKLGSTLGVLLSAGEGPSAIGTVRLHGGYVLTLALQGRPGAAQPA